MFLCKKKNINIEELLNELNYQFTEKFLDDSIESLVVNEEVLSFPSDFKMEIERFLTFIKKQNKELLNESIDNNLKTNYPKFQSFLKGYVNTTQIKSNILFSTADRIGVLKEIFEKRILEDDDGIINNISEEEIKESCDLFDVLIRKQIENHYSKSKFSQQFKEDFQINDFVLDYIYDLIQTNYQILFQHYVIETLTRMEIRMKLLEKD